MWFITVKKHLELLTFIIISMNILLQCAAFNTKTHAVLHLPAGNEL